MNISSTSTITKDKLLKKVKKDFYSVFECAIITFVANGSILGHDMRALGSAG